MPMPLDSADYVTLTAMISPALFMTANGSMIISTSNRLSRVVDRVRVLNEQYDAIGRGATPLDFPQARRAHVEEQLHALMLRGNRIRVALLMLYTAFGSFVGTSLSIGLDMLLEHQVVALPTALAVVGVCLMLAAAVQLVREALLALQSYRREIHFYRELQRLRLEGETAAPVTVMQAAPPT